MAYKNTVKDYSQMIGFLTRDKTTDVPEIGRASCRERV